VLLSNATREDTGFKLFHMNTGGNISCASCHPEGTEDGHTWQFQDFGLRRSQSLAGGSAKHVPFHWSGELANFDALIEEVMMKRMSMPSRPSADQLTAFGGWLGALRPATPNDDLDAAAVKRGKALFESKQVGCASCHAGSAFTDDLPHDVGTGAAFITPPLVGVAARTPLMHDGCALTLSDRFGVCGGDERHGDVSALGDADIEDLTAFLSSL
jgi:cytochrome c